jgi:hypothetical protein
MRFRNSCYLAVLALCFCAAANAATVKGNSGYGEIGLVIHPCTGCVSGPTLGATITGEDFDSTSLSDIEVYDFLVVNPPAEFNFFITATGAPINSATDLGLFTCDNSGFFTGDYPQCSNFTPPASIASSLSGNIASFLNVTASTGNTFDFFVALDVSNGPPTSVTASIAAAPEPRFLPLAGIGLLAALVLFHHWGLARSRTAGDAGLAPEYTGGSAK